MRIPEIGRCIRQARESRHLTQAQVADTSGVTRTTLNQLENGLVADLGIRKVEVILEAVGLCLVVDALKLPAQPDYLRMASTTASASYATVLSENELYRALVTGKVPRGKTAHVRHLLEEAPASLVRGLVSSIGKPGRVEKNVLRLAVQLGIPAEKVSRWKTTG
jgi:transcriptional regulator with XRE-family HTH domain